MPTNIFSQPTEINALFTIGGTDNVAVTSTGSVGIGTTSPGAKLAVNSTGIAATPTISLTNTSSAVFNHTINAFAPNLTAGENNIFIIGKEGNTKNAGYIGYTWNADADNSNVLTFGHWASDNLMNLTGDGKLGIGTTTPSSILSIKTTSTTADTFQIDAGSVRTHLLGAESGNGVIYLRNSSNSNYVRINAGGNSYFNGGNVGIGTTSPSSKLDIVLDSIGGLKVDTNSDGGATITTYQGSTNSNVRQIEFNAQNFQIKTGIPQGTSTTDALFIDSSQNVGIGTTSPSEKLEVNGNIKISSSSEIIFDDNNSVGQSFIKSGGDLNLIIDSNNNQNVAALIVEKDTQTAGDGTELFRVQENGNVGINNTSPTAKLDVDLNSSNSYDSATLTTSVVAVANRNSSNVNNQAAGLHLYATGWAGSTTGVISLNAIQIGGNSSTADFAIQTRNNGTYAEKFRLTAAGNVGIGTTSPAVDLHVRDSNQNSNITDTIPSWWSAIFERSYSTASSAAVGIVGGSQSEGVGGSLFLGYSDDVDNSSIQLVSNTMRFTVNTSEKMRINEDGNVGIGTTSPRSGEGTPLTLESSTGYVGITLSGTGDYANVWQLYASGDGSSNNFFGIYDRTNSVYTLATTDDGNVGIGTTTPGSKLEIDSGVPGSIKLGELSNYNGISLNGTLDIQNYNLLSRGTDKALYINRPSGHNIFFRENNTATQVTIANGGNVGIGTTSPNFPLSFGNSLGNKIALYDAGSGAGYGFGIQGNLLQMFSNASGDDIAFGYGNSTSFVRNVTFKGTGNVGIGTTSPTKKLHVDSDGNEVAFFKGNSGGAWIDIQSSTSNLWSIGAVDANKMGIYNRTNATYPLVVENGGNVGIGTTSPVFKLEVSDTVAGGEVIAQVRNPSSTAGSSAALRLYSSGVGNMPVKISNIPDATGGTLVFNQRRAGNTYHDTVVFRGDGNVGIGTTSPSYRLDVVGTTYTSDDLLVGIGNASSWHRVSIHTGGFIAQSGNKGIGVYADATDSNNNLFAYDYDSSSFKPLKIDVSTLNITNGTSSVIYHNGTNVGIGTTSPDAKLKIINSSETNPGLTICNAAGGGDGFNFQRWQYVESSTGYRLDLKQRVTSGVVQYAFDMVNNGTTYNSVLVLDRGNVGIGTTSPAYKLDVSGTIRATGDVIAFSDARVKENVETIPNALDKVKAMRGVGYNKIGEEKRSVGVIAQELLEVLPEAVHQDDEGMYSVAYGNVVGVLIEAIKDLTSEVESLKALIDNK